MNILIITFSGIPTTDYCLPLIDKLQNEHDIQTTYLLSHSLNSKNIFNEHGDSERMMDSMNIVNIDLSTFSIIKYINSIFKFSLRNTQGNNYFIKLFNKLEKALIKNLNLTIKTLKKIKPDVVFFDHRQPESIENYKEIFDYLTKEEVRVFLTPHAPHYLKPKEHLSTNLDQNVMSKIVYLDAFKYTELSEDISSQYKDIICTSYPGLEDFWLDRIKKLTKYENSLIVMLRPFHTISSKWDRAEKVVLHQNELSEIIDCVNKISQKNEYENIIVKPHPKNYIQDLEEYFLTFIKHKNITLYKDSIYNLISKNNHFISTYSTTALLPIANQSPTYIVNTEIFSKVFNDWDVLRDLYSKFSGFTTSSKILDIQIDTSSDKKHLNNFFTSNNYQII